MPQGFVPASTGGTSDHAALTHLDYASAGHTDFAGTGVANTFADDQTFDANIIAPNLPTSDPGDNTVWLDNGHMTVGEPTPLQHGSLTGLAYLDSGHTGFVGVQQSNTFFYRQSFLDIVRLGPELSTNGSFDDGGDPPDGWTYDGSVTASDEYSDTYYSGVALRLESSDAGLGASQAIVTEASASYHITVWAKVVSGSARVTIQQTDTLVVDLVSVISNSFDYTQINIDFDSNSTSNTVILSGNSPTDVVLFDELSVRKALSLSDHSKLDNLDYAGSGHTGFAGTGAANSFSQQQTINNNLLLNGALLTTQTEANTNPPSGATVAMLAIYTDTGDLIGYLPIYGSAW